LNALDFVPVAEERYDFLVRADALAGPFVEALRRALSSAPFARALGTLPGYRADAEAGRLVWQAS
jgi:putative molybdopterin biosynthesis protein